LNTIAEAFERTGKLETSFSSEEELTNMLRNSGLFETKKEIDAILDDEDLVNSLINNASETANLMNTILSTNE
jgi:hypothetical protein